jgi:lipoprotein-anchoring transpeptidase ErfK/SrfK
VKSLAVLFLLIGSAVAGHAFAEDAMPQPLTRADCEKAQGWSWSEHANVCEVSAQQAQAATAKPQPLTRSDCDLAGMSWNDMALVCEEKSASAARAGDVKGTNPAASSILINIDKSTQRMTVLLDGVQKFDWPVSTGKRGYSTPSGTFTPTSMNEIWYSKQWDNAPMPHAIFYMKDGHAIHGSYEVRNLGKPASHGCVRISPQNATLLYALVKATGLENTQVVLSGETPGGESKVASSGKPRNPARYYLFDDNQPRQRGGFFRRLFGAR